MVEWRCPSDTEISWGVTNYLGVDMKKCSTCGIDKELTEFHKRSDSKDGLVYSCKQCAYIRGSQWAKENRDKKQASYSKWYLANKQYHVDWQQANRQRIRELQKLDRRNNPEKYLEKGRKWREANREKHNQKELLRRVRKKQNGEYYIRSKFMKNLYAKPCAICSSTILIQADHIIPVSRGGYHGEGNLQPLCKACNLSKGTKTIMEWRISQIRKGA